MSALPMNRFGAGPARASTRTRCPGRRRSIPTTWNSAHALFARQIQGEAIDSEYRIRTPDGQEKWIRDRAFPIRDQAGELIRIVGIAEEITERKRYEAGADSRPRGRRAANRAKSRFLANMSHEIRTPMNGVIGMIQLLLETELTSEQRRYANVAQTSGRVLLALIDDILDLSKIEAGKIDSGESSFNLRAALSKTSSSFCASRRARRGCNSIRACRRKFRRFCAAMPTACARC